MRARQKVWGEIESPYPIDGVPVADVLITVRAPTLEGAAEVLAWELERIRATIELERSKGTWH